MSVQHPTDESPFKSHERARSCAHLCVLLCFRIVKERAAQTHNDTHNDHSTTTTRRCARAHHSFFCYCRLSVRACVCRPCVFNHSTATVDAQDAKGVLPVPRSLRSDAKSSQDDAAMFYYCYLKSAARPRRRRASQIHNSRTVAAPCARFMYNVRTLLECECHSTAPTGPPSQFHAVHARLADAFMSTRHGNTSRECTLGPRRRCRMSIVRVSAAVPVCACVRV